MFKTLATIQRVNFNIVIISIYVKIISLNIDYKKFVARRLLRAINVLVLNSKKTLNIIYVSYLTKEFEKQKYCFIVIKFEDLTTINQIIIKKLV